jgi:hypothetical protein
VLAPLEDVIFLNELLTLCVVFNFEPLGDNNKLEGRVVSFFPTEIRHLVVKVENTRECMSKEFVAVKLNVEVAKEIREEDRRSSDAILPTHNLYLVLEPASGPVLCTYGEKYDTVTLSSALSDQDPKVHWRGMPFQPTATVKCSLMESMTYQDIKPRPFCPILTYNPVKTQWTHVRYSLSIFGIFPKSAVVNDVREEMFSSLTAQLQEVVDMVSWWIVQHLLRLYSLL